MLIEIDRFHCRVQIQRIRAYECLYKEGKISFAVTPTTAHPTDTAAELMRELMASINDIVQESPKLMRITGTEEPLCY